MVPSYSSLAFWAFLITLFGILTNVLMQILRAKESGTGMNWWTLLPLGLAFLATLLSRHANVGLSELSSQRVDSLQSQITVDAVNQAHSDSTIDALKHALDISKRDITTIKGFMPPSFVDANSKALYQNGKLVGVYDSYRIDKTSKHVFFKTISNSNNLDFANPVVFSKFRLQFIGAGTITSLDLSRPSEGRIIEGARFRILDFK